MTQKRKLRDLVRQSAPTLVVVIIGILFYMICFNFPTIQIGIGKFLHAIGPIILGIVFAFVLNIPMSFFERFIFKGFKKLTTRRALSLISTLLLFALLITALIALIIPRVILTITDITNNIFANYADYLNKLYVFIDSITEKLNVDISAEQEINAFVTGFFDDYKSLVNNIVPFITQATGNILNFLLNSLLMIVFGIYMLASKEKYIHYIKTFFVAVLPKKVFTFFFNANSEAYGIIRKYVIGTLVDCFSLGVMTFIGLMILKVFFPMDMGMVGLLSVLIGVTQLLPVIGPWIGSAVGALLLIWYDPIQALWFIIVVLIVQQIDNNIVLPKIVGKMVGISGLLVISAVLVGSKLFGIVGALVSVPITAVLFAIASDIIARRIEMLNLTDKERAELLAKNRRAADQAARNITKEAVCFIRNSTNAEKANLNTENGTNPIAAFCTKTKEFLCKTKKCKDECKTSKAVARTISKDEAEALKNDGHVVILHTENSKNNIGENTSTIKTIKLKARVKSPSETKINSSEKDK